MNFELIHYLNHSHTALELNQIHRSDMIFFLISWHIEREIFSMKLSLFTYKDTEIQESGLSFVSRILQSLAFVTQFADNLTNILFDLSRLCEEKLRF